ncbi:Delta(24(24(1)))-sterol reductase [Malassezia psittaci]|uniref:Delta(24(24(1)))-sterol reductase n=1 Tax=Malassezia psittaci TaxID=1821823 RepID=A0AAF0JEK1_9BASI|nr:Delta(24(24(1)))-sterol reductase [Malassezia psittaci]
MAGYERQDAMDSRSAAGGGNRQSSKKRGQSLNHTTYDCRPQMADADAPLPWSEIEQVILSATTDLPGANSEWNCPICLSAPSAPRMTRCGHVFCYACILHYLIVAEDGARARNVMSHKHSKRCPICWDEVHARDLKAVHWIDAHQVARDFTRNYLQAKLGTAVPEMAHADTLTMRLIERPNGSSFALPRSETWPSTAQDDGVYCFQPDALLFSRIVLSTPELIEARLVQDVAEIDAEIENLRQYTPDELSVDFLHVAKQNLQEQIAKAQAQHSATSLRRVEIVRTAVDSVLSNKSQSKQAAGGTPSNAYYFYQAASGQNVFLHPLDVKVLLGHYGGYVRFPDTLQIAIQHAEEGTMDDALRRKCKYIAHLPMASDVTFVEVDWPRTLELFSEWQDPIAYAAFQPMLHQRQVRHREKQHREDRARLRAEKQSKDAKGDRSHEVERNHDPEWSMNPSMSFAESALIGAEMYFPRHPGADEEEHSMAPDVPQPSAQSVSTTSAQRTVWGTAAAPTTANNKQSNETQQIDDAWNAFEQQTQHKQDSQQDKPNASAPTSSKTQKRKPKLILTGGGRGSS